MVSSSSNEALTKGARITGDQRDSLGAELARRYDAGESVRAIAEDLGRSYGFVHGVLRESGVTLRGRGGATRGPARTPSSEAPPAAKPKKSGEKKKPKKSGKKK